MAVRPDPTRAVPELVRNGEQLRLVNTEQLGMANADHLGARSLTWGTDPNAIGEPITGVERDGADLVFADPAPPGVRPYVRVDDAVTVAERRLPLHGAPNTRDLGGYRTADGHTVQWGRVYRSGALHRLTGDDVAYLERLGIRLIIDLRRPAERAEMPSRVADSMEVVHIPIGDVTEKDQTISSLAQQGALSVLGKPGAALLKSNEQFVRAHGPQFRDAIAHLARAVEHPVLVHCTGGKDRAGFASACMLLALGVPEEVVVFDYLRTNDFTTAVRAAALARHEERGGTPEEAEILRALMEVRPEYLGTALATIAEVHGSNDAFLRDALGLDDARVSELRATLLD